MRLAGMCARVSVMTRQAHADTAEKGGSSSGSNSNNNNRRRSHNIGHRTQRGTATSNNGDSRWTSETEKQLNSQGRCLRVAGATGSELIRHLNQQQQQQRNCYLFPLGISPQKLSCSSAQSAKHALHCSCIGLLRVLDCRSCACTRAAEDAQDRSTD